MSLQVSRLRHCDIDIELLLQDANNIDPCEASRQKPEVVLKILDVQALYRILWILNTMI